MLKLLLLVPVLLLVLFLRFCIISIKKQTGLPRPEGQGVQLVKLKERTKVPTA